MSLRVSVKGHAAILLKDIHIQTGGLYLNWLFNSKKCSQDKEAFIGFFLFFFLTFFSTSFILFLFFFFFTIESYDFVDVFYLVSLKGCFAVSTVSILLLLVAVLVVVIWQKDVIVKMSLVLLTGMQTLMFSTNEVAFIHFSKEFPIPRSKQARRPRGRHRYIKPK